MKTIIAGSRTIQDYTLVDRAVTESGFTITEVVSGTAQGVDRVGEQWAYRHNIPIARFPAHWEVHGNAAGSMRNAEMATYADALIAVWDGQSRGTEDMIVKARERGLQVFVLIDRVVIEKHCPLCHAPMTERTNSKNGSMFLGCANYPNCRHTEPVPESVKLRRQGQMDMFETESP